MAVTVKSPGVYIEEISVLPPSVAPVATAVPAFIGYTEKGDLAKPTRIRTLLEFEHIFGGPFKETFAVVTTLTAGAYVITPSVTTPSKYMLYQSMQLFFANAHRLSPRTKKWHSMFRIAVLIIMSGNN